MKDSVAFKEGEFCVYKTHGVGKVKEIQQIKVGNFNSSCYIVYFERERLTISVPFNQVEKGSLRRVSNRQELEAVFEILRNGTKKVKGMWSRRAKEYEGKINSGDIILIAEVLRDLTRDIADADRSYSERVIYETALYRLASEYSIVFEKSFETSKEDILEISKEKIRFASISEMQTEELLGEAVG